MKSVIQSYALTFVLLFIISTSAFTQELMVPSMSNATEMSLGEVRKIDKDNNKIVIRHGELKNLDMPPMTMVFQVKEPTIIDKIKVGDKIKFRAEKTGSALVITDVQQAK